ncbi:MHS family MFS transporter [Xanthobacter dioxanivorans]|uniref:MHS family MFS transporter n=1 Tax=Xanthobacter dioxanivorans TaxID=2528964 RepID=A0A974PNU2_9HYPH|nr:MHS family MFS transporter [Xanthobacter dioxanivorans]
MAPASSRTLVACSTMIGTTIEWYDFFIFGTASALIFSKVYFPSFDPAVGTLLALTTFAVGLFARPFGAILFGHFGDRIGRKKMLVAGLLLMGIPTGVIGVLPTYDQIGILAPIALLLIRVCQGVALGGEWGGAVLMAVEHAPSRRGGLFGSLPQMGCPAALILSSVAFSLVGLLPADQFEAWGWRLPFIASFVLVFVGFFIRRKVNESPSFKKLSATGGVVQIPIARVFSKHLGAVVLGTAAKLGEITLFWLFAIFVLSYATGKLQLPRSEVLNATTVGAVIMFLLMPVCGILSDKFGKRMVFNAGTLLLMISAVPLFLLIETGRVELVWLAIVFALGILYPIMYAPEASLFANLFPVEVRYTGLSMCANIGGAIGGGIAPIVATALLGQFGSAVPVGLYLAAVSLISFLSVLAMKPRHNASAE